MVDLNKYQAKAADQKPFAKRKDFEIGKTTTFRITRAEEIKVKDFNGEGEREKVVLEFEKFDKALLLNNTSVAIMVRMFGLDEKCWVGNVINVRRWTGPEDEWLDGVYVVEDEAVSAASGNPFADMDKQGRAN